MQMTELSQDTRGRKTLPWMDDEYMVVDGMRVVYTVDQETGNLFVRMPGRTTESVEGLRAHGRSVEMPKLLRTNDYA